MCAPSLWFEELAHVERLDILGFKQSELTSMEARSSWKGAVSNADVLIIGGGGLLEIDFFRSGFDYISQNRKIGSKLVLWGAGHNNWQIGDWRKLKQSVSIDHFGFDMIGIRDFNQGHRWVPCASCMAPEFDTKPEPAHDIVIYAHAATLKNPKLASSLPSGLPILDNQAPFKEVIDFLASGDLVLTDSFHGMYWATLLGRRAIAFPSSSKFYTSRHPMPLCDPSDWKAFTSMAQRYPDALAECREENLKFSKKVFQWI